LDQFSEDLNRDDQRVAFETEGLTRIELTENYRSTYRKQLSIYYHVLSEWYPKKTVTTSLFYTTNGTREEIEPLSIAAVKELVQVTDRFE